MRLRASRDTPFVISPSSIEASRRSFKLDLPLCSNRLLNLPLIPRLSRFFSFFFHSFVFFVSPLRCAPSILLLLLLLPPSLHLVLLSLLSPPFCIPISLLRGLSPALFVGERYAPTGFELSRISWEAASARNQVEEFVSSSSLFRSNISDIDVSSSRAIKIMYCNFTFSIRLKNTSSILYIKGKIALL